jgi:hypothetical protein
VSGSGAGSEGGFGSAGRLQEYEMCNTCTGDIVDSVMICVGVPGGDSGGPICDWESTRSEGLDRRDDLRAGKTHEHTREDRYSRIAVGCSLQTAFRWYLS